MIFIIIWFDIASEEIELNANPFNPFFMSENLSCLQKQNISNFLKKLIIIKLIFF
jgi:hypothetical protein